MNARRPYGCRLLALAAAFTLSLFTICDALAQPSEWAGKRVAFLGDSMTDPNHRAASSHYWKQLEAMLGIEAHVYAKSGLQWNGIYAKAEAMRAAEGDRLDAILVWAGTNDYNHSVPVGRFYTERDSAVVVDGRLAVRRHRTWCMDDTTFCGRVNRVLSYLRHHYPRCQVVLLTPIHRAYAAFSERNIQPDEDFANGQGLYVEDYVRLLRQAGEHWSVPVVDLFTLSGLYPLEPADSVYFYDARTDRLHPNDAGHYRLARTLAAQLRALPVGGL